MYGTVIQRIGKQGLVNTRQMVSYTCSPLHKCSNIILTCFPVCLNDQNYSNMFIILMPGRDKL